jgi:hypothetical protein
MAGMVTPKETPAPPLIAVLLRSNRTSCNIERKLLPLLFGILSKQEISFTSTNWNKFQFFKITLKTGNL